MKLVHLKIVLSATFFACTIWSSPLVESKTSPSEVISLSKVLNGVFSLEDIYTLKHFYSNAAVKFQQLLTFSPVLKSVFEEASKKNIKAKVLSTFVAGHTPSMDDIIKLATTKSESIATTLNHVEKTNPKWQAMQGLMKPDQMKNHTALKEVLEMFAGRKIDVNSIKLKNDKYTVSERADLAYYNLLKLVYFIGDNYLPIKQVMKMLDKKSPDYQAMLPLIINMNYTSFPTTTVGSNAQKYSVTNAEATTLLNDVKTKYPQVLAQHDSKKIEDAVLNSAGVFLDLLGNIFGAAETLGAKEAGNSKQ